MRKLALSLLLAGTIAIPAVPAIAYASSVANPQGIIQTAEDGTQENADGTAESGRHGRRGMKNGERPEIQYDENGNPILPEGKELQYDEDGNVIKPERHKKELQYDEDGNPILPEGMELQYDEDGNPIFPGRRGGKGRFMNEDGTFEKNGERPEIQYDENGNPIKPEKKSRNSENGQGESGNQAPSTDTASTAV